MSLLSKLIIPIIPQLFMDLEISPFYVTFSLKISMFLPTVFPSPHPTVLPQFHLALDVLHNSSSRFIHLISCFGKRPTLGWTNHEERCQFVQNPKLNSVQKFNS